MSWKVQYYESARGDKPVEFFIKDQQLQTRLKILFVIDLLEMNGPFIPPQFSKKVDFKIYELRIIAKTQIRVLYTIHNNVFVLLHAFKKKTNKVPLKEIKIAIARRNELF